MKASFLLALAFALLAASGAMAQSTYTVPGTNITLTYTLSGSPQVATITYCNTDATPTLPVPWSSPIPLMGRRSPPSAMAPSATAPR